ncbi:KICSTOR complex protein SZT2 [Nymphon striatum]|nr:KICSTOR complex protein SZT2 [Nymphon striatum]
MESPEQISDHCRISSHKYPLVKQEAAYYQKFRKNSVGSSSGKESDTEIDLNIAKTKKLRKKIPRDASHDVPHDVPSDDSPVFNFDKDINDSDLQDHPIGHSSPKKIIGSNDSTKGLINPIPKLCEGMSSLPPKDQSKFGIVQQGTMSSFKKVHKSLPIHQPHAEIIIASSSESPSPDLARPTPAFHLQKKFKLHYNHPKPSDSELNANTNKDGYDSGSESDEDIILHTQCLLMPEFWLILDVHSDAVLTYFQTSQRLPKEDGECFINLISIQKQVINLVKSICKRVNQRLLLQNLNETRNCEILLVPESSNDIWKSGADEHPHHNSYGQINLYFDPDGSEFGLRGDYLADTMKLKPGVFSCQIVFETVFLLHPRLCALSDQGQSIGLKALTSALNPFTVQNRKNMFVYKESCGFIHYLRVPIHVHISRSFSVGHVRYLVLKGIVTYSKLLANMVI